MTKDRESRNDQQCLALGKDILRMINDLRKTAGADAGYARRKITFPGGEVHMLICNTKALADMMEKAVAEELHVTTAAPPSEVN